ncbi:hypothetical protein GPB2148_2099 [marine gamma proteobacterium HTCC2148]|nr:hypothetical protein GPB2148_2099 [marine gamma proteobacterium HTCC2148]
MLRPRESVEAKNGRLFAITCEHLTPKNQSAVTTGYFS